jgi:hypothetical protein
MTVWKTIFSILSILQILLAFYAEYLGDYTRAIYELMWAGAFYVFSREDG